MALVNETLMQEITALVRQRRQMLYTSLGKSLGGSLDTPPLLEEAGPLDEQAPLRRDLKLLMKIANGEAQRTRATRVELRQVELALAHLLELLLGNALQAPVTIPDAFWQTDVGVLVSRVRWWLSADDLITMSNAAALAFGENNQANRMRIARAMERGLLAWVPDPSTANPQHNRRVLRPQVERLRQQSRLPE